MKKFLLALAVAATAQVGAFAQNYSFTTATATYADLTGTTPVSAAGWDEKQYLKPIGFNFSVGNQTVTDVAIDDNGQILFVDVAGQAVKGAVVAFASDMMDRGNTTTPSAISMSTTGTAGSRITKIEWKNAGFFDQAHSTQTSVVPFANDFVNFQVWLYEGSNNVELRFGSNNITAANATAIFGPTGGAATSIITGITGTGQSSTLTGVALQGPAATPAMVSYTNATTFPSVTGVPTTGTIYRFSTTTSGIAKNLNNAALSVYPNPVADVMAIQGLTAKGNVTINVTDVLGKVVLTEKVAAAQNVSVNVSNLKKGAYTVEISSEEGRSIKQIIKQ